MKKKYIGFFIFLIIIFDQQIYIANSFPLPGSRSVKMLNDDWKNGDKNQAARFSLDPRGESCGLGVDETGDMAYQFDPQFEISNDYGGNNLFLSPRIPLRHAWTNNYLFGGKKCESFWKKAQYFSVKKGRTECYKGGSASGRTICVTTLQAPRNRRDLYVRLAKIQKDKYKKKHTITPHLQAVLNNDQNAINAGFCDFRDIGIPWVSIVKANPEKFIAKYPGQEMICAFDVTKFTWFSSQSDRCKNSEECVSNFTDLIKCLLLPMGPAPKPFAPFIMGEEKIDLVFDQNSTISNPVARIVVTQIDRKFEKSFNLFNSAGDILNSSDHNFQFGNSVYRFRFDINSNNREICSVLKSVNGSALSQEREVGCIPLIGEIAPELRKINSPLSIVVENLNSELKTKAIEPTSLKDLNDIIESLGSSTPPDNKLYIENETEKYISSFRTNFHTNPYNLKNRFIVKKFCNYNDETFYKYEIHEDLDHKCEESVGFSKGRLNLFQCSVDGEIVEQLSECDGSIGTQVKGFKCNDDSLIEESESCSGVFQFFDFEDDYAGESICFRNISSFFKENESNLIPRKINGKKYFHLFGENGKILVPIINAEKFDTNPDNFKRFGDFTQAQLDNLINIYGKIFSYTSLGVNTNYSYQNAFYGKNPNILLDSPLNGSIFSDSEGGVFFLDDEEFKAQIFDPDPISQGMCVDLDDNSNPAKEWEYVLQFPMYYSNYDISLHRNELIYRNDLNLKKIDGIFSSKDPKISSLINFNDINKKNILLVSSKVSAINPSVPRLAKIGISSVDLGDTIEFDDTKFTLSGSKFFENFNVWGDYVESLKNSKEVLYSDGTDLLDSSEKFFDTSDCNFIEFEIYSGGSSSKSVNNNNGTQNFMNDSSRISLCQNAHPGVNGGYVKGSFRIRPNSNLIIKVGGANGWLSSRMNGTNEFENSDDFSAIWVKENGDGNSLIATSKPKLIVKVDSGGASHFCDNPLKCSGLKIENTHSDLLENSSKDIIQFDNNSYAGINFGTTDQRRSFPINNFEDFNQNIAIEEFRAPNFSSVCGKTFFLRDTLPLSFPVILNKYNDYGIVSNEMNLNLKKTGTGNFNKIGSYFYYALSDSTRPFGGNVDWSLRSEYENKFETICKPALESCFRDSSISGIQANLANDSSFTNDITKKTTDDLNFYCPGLGGCYFSSETKAVSNSGTAGLVKISCKKKDFKIP